MVELEPRDVSGGIGDAERERKQFRDHAGAVRLAINKVRKALGINQVAKLIAYTSLEQEHQWEQLGVTISQIIKEGAGGRASDLDLLFTGEKTMAGVPIKSSINANQTRVDFLDLSHWGRAVMQDIDFYEVGGQTVFPIYGASGGLRRRTSFISLPASRCGTTRREAGRTSVIWPFRRATRVSRDESGGRACYGGRSIFLSDGSGAALSICELGGRLIRSTAGDTSGAGSTFKSAWLEAGGRTFTVSQIFGWYGAGRAVAWIGGRWVDHDAHGKLIR